MSPTGNSGALPPAESRPQTQPSRGSDLLTVSVSQSRPDAVRTSRVRARAAAVLAAAAVPGTHRSPEPPIRPRRFASPVVAGAVVAVVAVVRPSAATLAAERIPR